MAASMDGDFLEALLDPSTYLNVTVATLLIGITALVWLLFNGQQSSRINPQKAYNGPKPERKVPDELSQKCVSDSGKSIKIFYGTQTGTAKHFATKLSKQAESREITCSIVDLKTYDPDESLAEEAVSGAVCVFILSTYVEGAPPEDIKWFYKWIMEAASDFRVQKSMLKEMRYTVVGLGNSLYSDHFCTPGKNVDKWLHQLSAVRLLPVGMMDENVSLSKNGGNEADFDVWMKSFWTSYNNLCTSSTSCCGQSDTCCQEKETATDEVLYESSSEEDDDNDNDDGNKEHMSNGVMDMEDLGNMMQKMEKAKIQRKAEESSKGEREMITPILKKALEKQGYKLIGSHSGVKLCRWTKSMLRGRGGCYKHTFYGIESHRCMETTPSLACANKCVFCWRHHTNPVGTEWRWKMDNPELIINGAMENHYKLINQFKGVPGVKPERIAEGMSIKHCALSLVGEPIMYPEINNFVKMLHDKSISSFLVTNAQFPDAIRNLLPVTQLYVSVDASTKDALKKIDRPLFRDFWPRFLDSLKALSEKGQRTVYRLTLVKAWNTEELKSYADLIAIGNPDLIEIKGVTFCGDSKASSLTMQNVPWHEEVISFVQQLADMLPDYEIASEHAHSNCVLVAHKKFKVDGEWWTWIDYVKFHELIQEYNLSDGEKTFKAEDYMSKTPSWAVFGASEKGFDPNETRFFRKNRKDVSGC
ncbi:S-adenosyl-L-methionine-dependent tRNA 4-demethylwyosine synthase TYW1-like [Tubulanus polymorphus]|uniref:S-adenosyl-L-methionine-dependent tRNA 4-demethylwyosine synthase TYW1-like n=1 Tax=Tubulanus polymorphus TaxID=672921 RepID=UPI003DA385E9